jgi:hypothetical protein
MGGLFKTRKTSTTADKLSDFKINSASYGESVPVVLGTTKISGNVIDWYDFKAIPHTTTTRTGKGGGSKSSNTEFTYTVACLIGLCEGPITGIGTAWKDKEVYANGLSGVGMTLFNGLYGQSPWTYTQSKHPERALPYSGLAYVAGVMDLGNSNGLPTLSFEVRGMLLNTGDGVDVDPAAAISYIMSNAYNGVNLGNTINSDSLDRLSTYAKATDLLISTPPDSMEKKAYEIINDFCTALDTMVFLSQRKIKFMPLCMDEITAHGVNYQPNTTVLYDLTDDDFLEDSEGQTVIFERIPDQEAYNQYTIDYINRANSYESELVYEQIDVDVNNRGLRPADSLTMHFLHTKARASYVARNKALNSLTRRNRYTFRLDTSFCLLEPGDLLTLTTSTIGLDKQPVIVENWEEANDWEIEITAFGIPRGNYSAGIYDVHEAERGFVDYNVSPGNINQPVIFEPPANLENAMAIYLAGSGGENWGGCNIWVSDNDETYQQIGTIDSPARQGVLSSPLSIGVDQDIVNTLAVDLSMSRSELLSGTRADADNYNTLCYVGGELISYETATLTAENKYDLTYLRRGVYSTENKYHGVGEQFLRIDKSAIFSYPITEEQIGKTIYLKFTSWNVFGTAQQELDDVQVYSYVIKGTALTSPLANVIDLRNYYENGNMYLIWSPITDFRSPIEYEIRKGNSWGSAEILGRTFNTKFQLQGNGTYWVAAAYKNIYSYVPVEIIITGARYVQNVIAVFDEKETGWTGTVSGNAVLMDDEIHLIGSGDFDSIPDFDVVWNLDYYGFDAGQGIYQIPESHKIDIGAPALCNVSVNYLFYGDTIYPTFDDIPDLDAVTNWDGDYSQYVGCKVQINIDDAGWQDFSVGQYFGQTFNFRVILENYSKDVTAILSGFSYAVDVPDIVESKNVTVLADGISILYEAYFHAIPEPQITIFNAQEGDEVFLSFQGLGGFTIQIKNGGVGVERNINYMVQKY